MEKTLQPKQTQVAVAAFYKFAKLESDPEKLELLKTFCLEQAIKGTILLAAEGINGTIAGSSAGITAVLDQLQTDLELENLEVKLSYTDSPPFERLKVKWKKEIITMGLPEVGPNQQAGIPVAPQDWNDLIADPTVTVIDTRNHFEVGIGSFQGAQDPHIQSFTQFPDYVAAHLDPQHHPKIAMFCTGGIRCEKASAYILAQGFPAVYQLQGGILNYLAEIPPEQSLWQGECFVFDQRAALDHHLQPGSYDIHPHCGHPIAKLDPSSARSWVDISCPFCDANKDAAD
jgi:UPF0176 protein